MLTDKDKEIVDKIILGIGVDSLNRFETFYRYASHFTPPQYWYGLGLAYTSSDNLYSNKEKVRECFSSILPGRKFLMDESERTFLKKLPKFLKIYRAMTIEENKSGQYGISWTLKRKVAKFFKETYWRNIDTNHLPKIIKELVIPKSLIIAYFNEREEEEVIYLGK